MPTGQRFEFQNITIYCEHLDSKALIQESVRGIHTPRTNPYMTVRTCSLAFSHIAYFEQNARMRTWVPC